MKIFYHDNEVGVPMKEAKVIDLFKDNIKFSKNNIIACRCNNEIKSLEYVIQEGDKVDLIDITDKDGMRIYVRGVLFVMAKAFEKLYPEAMLSVNYQLSNAMFCEVINEPITDVMIKKVKDEMTSIIEKNLPIKKVIMDKKEAEEFYAKENTLRGKLQVENKEKNTVSLYFCEDYYNYFYGVMPISTGFMKLFDIKKYKDGFIVRYPNRKNANELGEFVETKKLQATLEEYDDINRLMHISTIKDLNDNIEQGKVSETVLTAEALHEKKIAQIADKIADKRNVKMVLIAGPSSSGKTTFAKRLGIQLKLHGLNPVTIGTDNYFVERAETPKDENGEYDFETIEALDLKLFNEHLTKLINGEEIEVPTFDFKDGTKVYNGNKMKLGENDILVIEGIHSLNDRLTSTIPKENKFKIYLSDLTVLNIDYFNRISTTDTRLIRRIVRDYNFRSYTALDTLKRWDSVNNGENKNIFPYQEEADAMFNSSLVYELAVLKKYAKPLLDEIDRSVPEYSEAKRLSTLLEYFDDMDETAIPNNSILREFIGGSIFEY